MEIEMTCRLCQKQKELRRSHVFPEFLYKHAYDEKHRYEIASLAGEWLSRNRQSGIWERLLCDECEKRLNKLETYSSMIIHRLQAIDINATDGGEAYVLGLGVDYKRFKLFLLSLVWRASISSRPPFAGVALGEHEEKLRRMILADDPGEASCYPSILQMFRSYRGEMRSVIMIPFQRKHEDIVAYRTYFMGLMCTTYLVQSSNSIQLKGILRENGELPIKLMAPMQENACVEEIMKGLPMDEESEDV
jgi:hypothetical protein